MNRFQFLFLLAGVCMLAGCGGSADNPVDQQPVPTEQEGAQPGEQDGGNTTETQASRLDQTLSVVLADQNITGDPSTGLELPSIDDPLSQLGMKLFYSKSLGGDFDSACVSCHHPSLGGGDALSLSVGVEALEPDLLGAGRLHMSGTASVPRNAPTTFNSALYRKSLFWDSRVAQLDGGIRTPDSQFGVPDFAAGNSLLAAQAKFPVTSVEEMKTEAFEQGSNNDTVRGHLAARIGGYDGGFGAQQALASNTWELEFQMAFGSSEGAESLVSYDNIATALAAYEGSQVFINNPWKQYIEGDLAAISDNAKRGAILFFTAKEDGGGDCSRCHSGDFFSDEDHHVVAFPQIGPGKGDGNTGDDDFGLARETGDTLDRYKFRTPSLLNVAATGPYGHAGAYNTLREVVSHYDQPVNAIRFFNDDNWCTGISITNGQSCDALYPNARANTQNARQALEDQTQDESINGINLNNGEVNQIVEFLEALTDPCVLDRECLTPWIPAATGGPDGNQLNAVDQFGVGL